MFSPVRKTSGHLVGKERPKVVEKRAIGLNAKLIKQKTNKKHPKKQLCSYISVCKAVLPGSSQACQPKLYGVQAIPSGSHVKPEIQMVAQKTGIPKWRKPDRVETWLAPKPAEPAPPIV